MGYYGICITLNHTLHELAHLHEPHHTPEFWRRVERALADFEHRKCWLAEHGMEVEGL